MSSAPYEIGIKIGMANGLSPILALLAKEVLGLNGKVEKLQATFKSLNKQSLLLGGGLSIAAGTALAKSIMSVADASKDLLNQQDRLGRAGLSQVEVLKLQATYYEKIAKAIPTASADEFLKTVGELRSVTGSLGEASDLSQKALKMDALIANTTGVKGNSSEFYKLLRAGELKGVGTDSAAIEHFSDLAYKYIIAGGGKLTPDAYLQFAKQGASAWIGANVDKEMPAVAAMISDLGGQRAGTAFNQLHNLQIGAHQYSKQQLEELQGLGIVDMSKVHMGAGGHVQTEPGALRGSLDYYDNEAGWVKDILWPAVQKAAGGDAAKAESIIAKITGNVNAGKAAHMLGDKGFLDQQAKDAGLADMVMDPDAAYRKFTTDNPYGVEGGVQAQYKSMMEAIGAPLMQAAMPVMKSVTDMFSTIGNFANSNPEAIKLVGEGLGGLAAGLTVLVARVIRTEGTSVLVSRVHRRF
jgi:hypothetical protein